jgi:hypothetical protein
MASYETIPIDKYSIWIRRFPTEKAYRTIYLSPPASYTGLVKLITLLFNDNPSGYSQSLQQASYGALGMKPNTPPVNCITAYTGLDDFQDIYRILQTENPCWFTYSLKDNAQVPTTAVPLFSSLELHDWILGTVYPPFQGEPVGEGSTDYSP